MPERQRQILNNYWDENGLAETVCETFTLHLLRYRFLQAYRFFTAVHARCLAPTTHLQAWALLLKHLCPSPFSLLSVYYCHVTKNLFLAFGARYVSPYQQKQLKLPCKALRPARTWGSRGTCRWSGCSIRSRRSWSIRRWQSTPGRPVTGEHPRAPSFPPPSPPMPCPPLPSPSCSISEGGRAGVAAWNIPDAQKPWGGGRYTFQQPGPSKSFSEHSRLCLLAQLLLKIQKAAIPDVLILTLSCAATAWVCTLTPPSSNEPS